ncbi:hypothetical protein MFLAVUS_007691 [Mucor flavus]|uniref:Uncharacterized protein n=1 Tax=Mucor flavus TaxID=439312 RepID=A0ABP9Z504_9FUNG
MTLVEYSVASPEKWQAVEYSSAHVDLTWDDRQNFIKVFELLTFLLDELQNQKENFQVLKEEHLGINAVAAGQSVEEVLERELTLFSLIKITVKTITIAIDVYGSIKFNIDFPSIK